MRRVALVVGVIAAMTACLGYARAGTPPDVWDIAKDPLQRDRWALHVRVERLIHAPFADDVPPIAQRRDEQLRLETARAMLEQADAGMSPDVRLRFDLGIVYERLASDEARNDLYGRVVDVLVPALEAAPDHPAAPEALEALVYAYAKLDRPREELTTWRLFLARLTDDRARVGPMMNMGEAEMRLGRLDDAIGTFRNVLHVCATLSNSSSRNSTYALTLWDLAVALDRGGDPRGAIDTAWKARELSWKEPIGLGQVREWTGWDVIRDATNVFFVPDWEREWYLALGYAAAARGEQEPHQAALLWGAAENHWETYAARAAASPGEDRWLPIARIRRDHARLERTNAEKRTKPRARGRTDESSRGEHRL
ncbi:MAG: tetratricopeptide repeat protein [Myxococcota bacterium]|nr:tetratricopeptide repeat protein [Myxococcota bacterium]